MRPRAQGSHSRICTSVPQMPAAETRIKASFGPNSGSGQSRISRPGAGSALTMAFACAAAAERLMKAAELAYVDCEVAIPDAGKAWMAETMWRVRVGLGVMGVLPDKAELLSDHVNFLLDRHKDLTDEEIYKARKSVPGIEPVVAELFQKVDLLMTPTTAFTAHGATDPLIRVIDGKEAKAEPFGFLANACWLPSISIPAGIASDGMPVGLQINARRQRDDIVLRLARIFEQIQPWPRFAPGCDDGRDMPCKI